MTDIDARTRTGPGPAADSGRLALAHLPIRLFLAVGWTRAAIVKMIDIDWWRGRELRAFVRGQHDHALPFFRPFLDDVVAPHAPLFAVLVAVTQLGVGVAFATGRRLGTGVAIGVSMNVAFVMSGVVNPSAFYLVMQVVLLLGLADERLLDRSQRPPRWSLSVGGVCTVAAIALLPFVRALHPDRVIEDPAAMLAFLCAICAGSVAVRWIDHLAGHGRLPGRVAIDPTRLQGWVDGRTSERGAPARPAPWAPPVVGPANLEHGRPLARSASEIRRS